VIFVERALLPEGWAERVRITVTGGHIASITAKAKPHPNDALVSALLPALSNLHGHSFQRAMAGMTEHRVAGRESFWTWRDLMYRFLDRLMPDQIEAIAALVFMEVQEAGYAAVGEFN
jgi:formimidoylglutamate deiminase